jgi:hypothetical protein
MTAIAMQNAKTQPESCRSKWVPDATKPHGGAWSPQCPNIVEEGGGFEGERYRCKVCGYSYFLDYDDMK